MAAELATCTRHHKISTKIIHEMRVSQTELITKMSEYIMWLLTDKSAFYRYEKTYVLTCVNLRQNISFFFSMNT